MHNEERNLIIEFDWGVKEDGPYNFKIYGDDFAIEQGEWPEVLNLFVLKDGKPEEIFGETFAGHDLDAFDLLCKAISSYVNEETAMYFSFVCDEIKAFKEEFMKDNQGLGKAKYSHREIYLYILNSNLDKLECDACYSANGVEYGAYIGENEIVAIVDTSDGSLVTDYESFYIDHITGLVEQPSYKLEFHSENFKEVMSDYDIDVDELAKNCSEVK